MPTMSIVTDALSSKEASIFHQIAMFSVAGLAMSMALVIVFGLREMVPWF